MIDYLREHPSMWLPVFAILITLLTAAWRIGKPKPIPTYRQGCLMGLLAGMLIVFFAALVLYPFFALRLR